MSNVIVGIWPCTRHCRRAVLVLGSSGKERNQKKRDLGEQGTHVASPSPRQMLPSAVRARLDCRGWHQLGIATSLLSPVRTRLHVDGESGKWEGNKNSKTPLPDSQPSPRLSGSSADAICF
jgi:hypothetical protein